MNQQEKVDAWTPLVKAMLESKFGAKTQQLYTLLQETGSLISGGSVLSSVLGEYNKKQDTDMYVPVKHIPRFLDEMIVNNSNIFPATHYKTYAASFYCSSFLRKNGIRRVYNFGTLNEDGQVTSEVDIMAVRNKRGPLAVVNNFDLTFCQVWFDGKDVYASHPEDIKKKQGALQLDYCVTLLSGNKFLKNRVRKYLERGFTITFDERLGHPEAFNVVLKKLKIGGNQDTCLPVDGLNGLSKFDDPEYASQWYRRIAMRYFLGIRDGADLATGEPCLVVPLKREIYNSQFVRSDKDNELVKRLETKRHTGEYRMTSARSIDLFVRYEDEGYDSDDMDDETLRNLAITNYKGTATSDDLKYHRSCTNLVLNVKSGDVDGEATLGSTYQRRQKTKPVILEGEKLIGIIVDKTLRSGDDLFGEEGKLYDIHEHPLEAATTSVSLENYLGGTMTDDNFEPKCYYSGGGCTKTLKLHETKRIVSREFFSIFSAPRPVKMGLDLEVDNFEAVFRNIKTVDPAWGNIYHATMCPYCLKFEERGYGCAYMTHENVKGIAGSYAPFCQEARVVSELREKYTVLGMQLSDGYAHLEFCVECGRPCSGHKHFNLDNTGLVENQQIPDPRHPGQMMYDYGNCPGGGRPELIARMMAVRDVYRRKDLRDTKEERLEAARAAEVAPKNADLMARANAIWLKAKAGIEWNEKRAAAIIAAKKAVEESLEGNPQKEQMLTKAGLDAASAFALANPEPPLVKWNIDVPKTKAYTDPLYAQNVNDPDFNNWLDNAVDPAMETALYMSKLPNPNKPADKLQHAWNKEIITFIKHLEPLDYEIEEQLEKWEQIAALGTIAEQEISRFVMKSTINMNLTNALAIYAIYKENSDKIGLAKKIAQAMTLGGQIVIDSLDPDIGEAYKPKFDTFKELINQQYVLTFLPIGGNKKRRTYKRSRRT